MAENDDGDREGPGDESVELDPDETVVVSSGIGERFHRPNGLGYDTACKTEFKYSGRYIALSEALEEGFTPCHKYGCFREANG